MKKQNYFKMLMISIAILVTSSLMASPFTVNAFDSEGNPIPAVVKYWIGPNYQGQFDANTSIDVTPGTTYKFHVIYAKTSTDRVTFIADAGGNTFDFHTTKVQFHWDGGYLDYRGTGSWHSFGKTNGEWNARELFPNDIYGNTMQIHFGKVWNDPRGINVTIDYEGMTNYEKVASQLQLKDSNGNPLQGGTARGGYVTPTTWHVPGQTNANGLLMDLRNGSNPNLAYEMKYNNTTFWIDPQESSFYEFQTQLFTIRMETCDGDPIDGGSPAYGAGTATGTWWFPGGATGSSAPGESTAEMFDGTFSFRMQYKATTEYKMEFSFPDDGTTLTWTTTNVTLNSPYSIAYGGASGDSRWFTKPSMELLSGTYKFHFYGPYPNPGARADLTIEGCDVGKSIAIIQVLYSDGSGYPGVQIDYRIGWGTTPYSLGVTDANGNALYLGDPVNHLYVFATTADGGSDYLGQWLSNPYFLFQTISTTSGLYDSDDSPIAATSIKYASGWAGPWYDHSGAVELMPDSYYFRVEHDGTVHTYLPIVNITTTPDVHLYTTTVTCVVAGKEPFGSSKNGDTFQYKYNWGDTYMPFTNTTEIMSGEYAYFRHVESGDYLGKTVSGDSYTVTFGGGDKMFKDGAIGNYVTDITNTYPNPFTGETTVEFSLEEQSNVSLKVYNSMGQEVSTLVNESLSAGTHKAVWNGNDYNDNSVESGIYIYRLVSGDKTFIKKIIKK